MYQYLKMGDTATQHQTLVEIKKYLHLLVGQTTYVLSILECHMDLTNQSKV